MSKIKPLHIEYAPVRTHKPVAEKKQPKVKITTYSITVNPNKADPTIRQPLAEAWDEVYSNIDQFIIYNDKKKADWSYIRDVVGYVTIEVGDIMGRYHVQGWITFYHYTNINLDRPKIVKHLNYKLYNYLGPGKSVKFIAKFTPDHKAALAEYNKKQLENNSGIFN